MTRPTGALDEREREALAKIESDRIVDNRVYTDPAVLEREYERIFEAVWLFVAHESELAEPGDFVTTVLAGTPILVTRDHDRRLRAFYNTCRHRGSLVCEDERGHCGAFRCPYHSWVYSLQGELVSLPGEEAYDGTGFQKEHFPLLELACDSALGLVFVHLGDDPPALADWLGPEILEVLRKPLGHADFVVTERHADQLAVNWKVFAENARDGYHVPFVHPFFRHASPPGTYHLFANGAAVQFLGMSGDKIDPDLWAQLRSHPLPGVEVGEGYIVNLYPDVAITLRSNVVSIDWQVVHGPTSVTMHNRTLGLAEDDDEVAEVRRLSQKVWFADPVQLEDYPIFDQQQRGVASRKVRYSVIARGVDAETGTRGDDNRLRQFWVEWRRLMGTAGNSLDPPPGAGSS